MKSLPLFLCFYGHSLGSGIHLRDDRNDQLCFLDPPCPFDSRAAIAESVWLSNTANNSIGTNLFLIEAPSF